MASSCVISGSRINSPPWTNLRSLFPSPTADASRRIRCDYDEGAMIPQKEIARFLMQACSFAQDLDQPFSILVSGTNCILDIVCDKFKGVMASALYVQNLDMDEKLLADLADKLAPSCVSLTVKKSSVSERIFQIFANNSSNICDLEIIESKKITAATLKLFATPKLEALVLIGVACLQDDPSALEAFSRRDISLGRLGLGNITCPARPLTALFKESLKEVYLLTVDFSSIEEDIASLLRKRKVEIIHVGEVSFTRVTYDRLFAYTPRSHVKHVEISTCSDLEGRSYKDVSIIRPSRG